MKNYKVWNDHGKHVGDNLPKEVSWDTVCACGIPSTKLSKKSLMKLKMKSVGGQDTPGISRHQLVSHSGALATQAPGQALSQVVHHDLSLLLLLHATSPRSTSLPTRPLGKDRERLDAAKYTYPDRDRRDIGTDAISVPL
jgi:hypothetical protein